MSKTHRYLLIGLAVAAIVLFLARKPKLPNLGGTSQGASGTGSTGLFNG